MARITNIVVDALQDLVLKDTIYPLGTSDNAIDQGIATPADITGQSYEVVIHAAPGDGASLKTYTTGGGGCTIPVGTDGQLWITVPLADLATIGVGTFVFYARRTDSGSSAVVSKGEFKVVAV